MTQLSVSGRRVGVTVALVIAGALLVAVTAVVAAPAGSSGLTNDAAKVERLRETELTRLRALVEADMTVAGPIHADDFRLVPPHGGGTSREEYLGAVAAGDIDYLVFEPISEMDVRLYGSGAVLTYKSRIDIVVAGLGRFAHDTWHTYVYELRKGRWQVVWEQATAIGGFPPPG